MLEENKEKIDVVKEGKIRRQFERNPGDAVSYKLKKTVSGRQSIRFSKIRLEKLCLKMEII